MKRIQQLTSAQFDKQFPDEDACKTYLRFQRWGDKVVCPRCACVSGVYPLVSMPFKWECTNCAEGNAYRFSVLVGTIFENTNKPLREWFKVIHLMLTSKKGISALQVQRYMGFGSYETALNMCHKIRAALVDNSFQKLMGIVEVDETYVGGKFKQPRDKGGKPLGKSVAGPHGPNKSTVAGAVSRKGKVIARVLNGVSDEILTGFINESVSRKVSLLCTDANSVYRKLGSREWPHGVVNHHRGEYVVGAIHTNTIEGFWSIIKRGIMGTYHKVSKKYLPLYVAEFQFKYNNRFNADIFGAAVAGC